MHRTTAELLDGLSNVAASPRDAGTLELIVARPVPGERLVLASGSLSVETGLDGDGWLLRGSRHTEDGSAEVGRQITIANARATELFAGPIDRWPLAGDQLYVDLDLSEENLPAGVRLLVGEMAQLEVSAAPHTGCAKFAERFGMDAARLANAPEGRRWNVRGINATVVVPGPIEVGDPVIPLR